MKATVIKDMETYNTEYFGISNGKVLTKAFLGAVYDKEIYGNSVIMKCEGGTIIVLTMDSIEWGQNIDAIMNAPVTLSL